MRCWKKAVLNEFNDECPHLVEVHTEVMESVEALSDAETLWNADIIGNADTYGISYKDKQNLEDRTEQLMQLQNMIAAQGPLSCY